MAIPLILAMTAEEIRADAPLPPNIAYLGCYFSAADEGRLFLPQRIPPGCGIVLDDRQPIPPANYSAVAERLWQLRPAFVILDFLRPAESPAIHLAAAIAKLPCPTPMPPEYAKSMDCPLFVPPIPPHVPLDEHLKPWRDRKIWLELALDATKITVTVQGSHIQRVSHSSREPAGHCDSMLHCHYEISKEPDRLQFLCYRTEEDLTGLLEVLPANVTHAVGLYQELGL